MPSQRGQVVRAGGGFYDVRVAESGEVVRCTMRGRLKQRKRRTDLCVIGDDVRIEGDTLEEVFPRRTVFSRRHPGKGGQHKEDVLVANLDQLVIVFAYSDPPFRPRLLDRFLVVAERNELKVVLVANKVDKRDGPPLFEAYEPLGYRMVETSAERGDGLESLHALLADRLSAFVGPSGVGKSSLLNAIDPTLALRIGATSASHGKGRHTTRAATIHSLGSGLVADTPGIRELGAWSLDPSELDHCFVEMRPHLGHCAFGDCVHDQEPRCAIKAQVGHTLSEARYDSYLRLLHGEGDR